MATDSPETGFPPGIATLSPAIAGCRSGSGPHPADQHGRCAADTEGRRTRLFVGLTPPSLCRASRPEAALSARPDPEGLAGSRERPPPPWGPRSG